MFKPYKVDRDELTCVEISGKGKFYRTDFLLDTEDDIEPFKAECSDYPVGSTGLVAHTGKCLIMNCQGEYV